MGTKDTIVRGGKYWSSPEDLYGILTLLITFLFLAINLVQSGGWRGCALSVAWCVRTSWNHHPDDSASFKVVNNLNQFSENNEKGSLPVGSVSSHWIAIGGTMLALLCRAMNIWRKYRHRQQELIRRRSTMTVPTSTTDGLEYRKRRRGRILSSSMPLSSSTAAIGLLVTSNLAMLICALVPMSCECLKDGTGWVYISWRDYVHDWSLILTYASAIVSAICSDYHRTTTSKVFLFYASCLFAILQTFGIWKCPTLGDGERSILLSTEVLAIGLIQLLHYGTVNHHHRHVLLLLVRLDDSSDNENRQTNADPPVQSI